jgi:hypothetical protein
MASERRGQLGAGKRKYAWNGEIPHSRAAFMSEAEQVGVLARTVSGNQASNHRRCSIAWTG